jgi:hypothetical protein
VESEGGGLIFRKITFGGMAILVFGTSGFGVRPSAAKASSTDLEEVDAHQQHH